MTNSQHEIEQILVVLWIASILLMGFWAVSSAPMHDDDEPEDEE